MRLAGERVQARLLRRLNRFAVLVDLKGREVMAHLPNSGRLRELMLPEATVYLTPHPQRQGRTQFGLAMVDSGLSQETL